MAGPNFSSTNAETTFTREVIVPPQIAAASWNSCKARMTEMSSVPVVEQTLLRYFPELGDFKIAREALGRNGKEHSPFVSGADEIIFNAVRDKVAANNCISVLELGCGSSYGLLAYPHGVLCEEDLSPVLSRAIKSEFKEKVDLTISDRLHFSLYFNVSNGILDHSVTPPKLPKSAQVIRRPTLDPQFEEQYGLKTINSDYANYRTSYHSLGTANSRDIIFARNQEPDHPENYAEILLLTIAPLLKDDGIIVFAFDTQEKGSYNSRESNHTIIIRKVAGKLDPNIQIFGTNGEYLETIREETFKESKAKRKEFPCTL